MHEPEDLTVYVSLLEQQSKYNDALEVLPGNLGSLLVIEVYKLRIRERLLAKARDYSAAAETAIKMYKLAGEERFLLWAVCTCSIKLQVLCDKSGEKLLLLAEGLLKHIASHSMHEPEVLMVYVSLVEQQSKYNDALEVLSGNLGSLLVIEVDKLRIQGRLPAKTRDYSAAVEIPKNQSSEQSLQENSGILTDIPTENEILGIYRGISEEIPRKHKIGVPRNFLGIYRRNSEETSVRRNIPRKFRGTMCSSEKTDEFRGNIIAVGEPLGDFTKFRGNSDELAFSVGIPSEFPRRRSPLSSQFIVTRLLCFWNSKNIKKYGKFMGITLLLPYEKVVTETERDYVPLSFMAWPKTSLITDDTQQNSHVTRSVSILGLRSGPLDLTEESKWGNKVGMEGEKLYIHMRKDRRRLSGRNSQEKHQDLAGTRLVSNLAPTSYAHLRGLSSFVCGSYHDEKAVGIYRVEMAVSDASDSALFVAFDDEMNKLTNDCLVICDCPAGMEDAHNIALPQCLRVILERALTFQQKLSREVMTTPAMMFQELYIEILLKLFK
ncbi:hypothetical protein F2Q69_00041676 [Brassica cretica]|uniref:Uncharacterized protein n=1 Tax=Brassica cretica TaxID=69181 RepID=A0A8S9NH75_BRACR|nr:hypothetical protein F2Q69_00041676 [Brassica cretica]